MFIIINFLIFDFFIQLQFEIFHFVSDYFLILHFFLLKVYFISFKIKAKFRNFHFLTYIEKYINLIHLIIDISIVFHYFFNLFSIKIHYFSIIILNQIHFISNK